jgi:hypothetical protein
LISSGDFGRSRIAPRLSPLSGLPLAQKRIAIETRLFLEFENATKTQPTSLNDFFEGNDLTDGAKIAVNNTLDSLSNYPDARKEVYEFFFYKNLTDGITFPQFISFKDHHMTKYNPFQHQSAENHRVEGNFNNRNLLQLEWDPGAQADTPDNLPNRNLLQLEWDSGAQADTPHNLPPDFWTPNPLRSSQQTREMEASGSEQAVASDPEMKMESPGPLRLGLDKTPSRG